MYVETSLHFWNKVKLIVVDDIFEVYLYGVLSILLRIFASVFIRDVGQEIFLLCLYLVLVLEQYLLHRRNLGVLPMPVSV